MEHVSHDELPNALIPLFKGIVYGDSSPDVWRAVLSVQSRIRDYVRVLGLDLIVDEAEGYAFLRQREAGEEADGGEPARRLIPRRPLSYPVSLLLVLLRKRLAQHDASGGDTRLVLSREQIVEMLRVFLAAGPNEAKLEDQIDSHIRRVEELGFLRAIKEEDASLYEVRRILRAFVNADWLADLESTYREHAQRAG
ncbi:MAG TPA: DUF4194 domain-containing protein [Steroidobacter sp.]|jgi:hypothetical protein|nr:DUF4194 domain-containing protein [Steroidobacteraceae bacterium]HLS80046.1 DUF4194 domain-containing protein [Steroidobacter sp.]